MGKYKNLKERLGEKAKYYNGDLDLSTLLPYTSIELQWICEECGEKFNLDSKVMGSRYKCNCDKCRWADYLTRPTGRTHQWLLDHGLTVYKEQSYNDLRTETGRKLRFDYCAVYECDDGNIYLWLIELQGRQHDEYSEHFHKSYEEFKKQQEYDQMKRDYCKQNNIPLIEIRTYKEEVEDVLDRTIGIDLFLL